MNFFKNKITIFCIVFGLGAISGSIVSYSIIDDFATQQIRSLSKTYQAFNEWEKLGLYKKQVVEKEETIKTQERIAKQQVDRIQGLKNEIEINKTDQLNKFVEKLVEGLYVILQIIIYLFFTCIFGAICLSITKFFFKYFFVSNKFHALEEELKLKTKEIVQQQSKINELETKIK